VKARVDGLVHIVHISNIYLHCKLRICTAWWRNDHCSMLYPTIELHTPVKLWLIFSSIYYQCKSCTASTSWRTRNVSSVRHHLISGCPCARRFWSCLGWRNSGPAPAACLWETTCPVGVPPDLQSTLLLLCCWQLWKHRNEVIFRQAQPSLPYLLTKCREDALLWKDRLPPRLQHIADSWCSLFLMH
jgi:hypothetical protein